MFFYESLITTKPERPISYVQYSQTFLVFCQSVGMPDQEDASLLYFHQRSINSTI